MLKIALGTTAALTCLTGAGWAATINDFTGAWSDAVTNAGGTAEIVDLTGTGGNLESGAPDSNGAVRLTTDSNTATRAEVGIAANFGVIGDIFDGDLSFSYNWYDESGTAPAAPALKLAFYDPTYGGDGYGQLIYEPYWQSVDGNSTITPTQGDWVTTTINLNTGRFWNTGMFGIASSAGGPPNLTLAEWLGEFNTADPSGFSGASLVGISIGLGTYNTNEIGYFDQVSWTGTLADNSYDFEVAAAVPLPAGLPLMLGGLGLLGAVGWRKRRG